MSAVRFLLLLLCLSLSPSPNLSLTEAEALLAFKKGLSDPTQKLSSWKPGSEPCNDRWDGVFCQKDKPLVTGLHLQDLGLSGTIDVDSLIDIKNFRSLSLSNNSFTGPLPAVKKLTGLKALYVDSNKFTGEIPDDFFDGITPRRVWLSNNEFTGKIPASLVKVSGLAALHLEGNKFSGPIPEFSQPSLTEVNLSDNQLEGQVPASMEKFGGDSFKGNPGVCGKVVGNDCKKSRNHNAVVVVLAIAGVMALLVIVLIAMKSKNHDDDFSVLGKEPMEDVVEVRVQGNPSNGGGGGGGGSSKHASSAGGGGGGGSSKRSVDSSSSSHHSKKEGSRKGGSHHGKNAGMGDLIVINDEKGVFGLADLMKAAAEVLGNGGLGSAYKALMSNGVSVVVKRIRDMNNLGKDEFDAEIRRIGSLRHKNILTPLAYHYRKEEKLVVSEYIPKGSLLYVLHGDRGLCHAGLNWPTRLQVIKGIASGMQFLHAEFSSYELPHGNLKSSNVLLNDNYEPLLSDYAFLRMVTPNQAAQGMFAFRSPEVVENPSRVSPKSDVYCFGIIILEILTGKFPSQYLNAGKGGTDVIQWVRSAIEEKKEAEFLDPEIASSTDSLDPMIRLLHVGAACCESDPNNRPTMNEAIVSVNEIQA